MIRIKIRINLSRRMKGSKNKEKERIKLKAYERIKRDGFLRIFCISNYDVIIVASKFGTWLAVA